LLTMVVKNVQPQLVRGGVNILIL